MTYNTENEKGYMAQNPGIVPIQFAEGEGFKQEVTAKSLPQGLGQAA